METLLKYKVFLHVCESLGLVRRTEMRQPAVQHSAGGYDPGAPDLQIPDFKEAQFWEIVPGKENDSAWADPWGARYPSSRMRLNK